MFYSAWKPSAKLSTRYLRPRSLFWSVIAASLVAALSSHGQQRPAGEVPSTTRDRVNGEGWWPTKSTVPIAAFAGEAACGQCHAKKSSSQLTTPMAGAAIRVVQHAQSAEPATGSVQLGTYLYQVSSDHSGSRLTVSSGKQSITADIIWIFGKGVHGQTYILEKDGALYESQVSAFAGLRGMDLTPGHVQVEAGNLKNALGERLSTSMAARCFACHTTYSSTDFKFDAAGATPGIHCEACHGPGVAHINAIHNDQHAEAIQAILNPANLSPVESVDFCGACHRTTMDVVESTEAYGPINVRFQPYRLEKSRCWGTQGDARLTCIACHNPHEPLVRTAADYDKRCLECHAARASVSPGNDASPAACPVATSNCVSCHMPKSDAPGMHAKFTDHFIRIVRADETYPN